VWHGLHLRLLSELRSADKLDFNRVSIDRTSVPRRWPEKLCADKGYDYTRCRARLKRHGIKDRIARKGIERNDGLGRHRSNMRGTRSMAWFWC